LQQQGPLVADVTWRIDSSRPVHSNSAMRISVTSLPTSQRVQYDGQLGELARLCFTNLGLSIATLGFYRFWGKTDIRRYIWSHTVVLGERLEYLGSGRELLLGFLKTILFVAVLVAIMQFAPSLFETDSLLGIGIYLASAASLGLLYLAAQFAAQRYRLTRTAWCGIRGGMDGSAWGYAFESGLYFLPAAAIGLLIPWWRMGCLDRRVAASRLGNARAYLDGRRKICFWSFMLGSALIGAINVGLDPAIQHIAQLPLDHEILEALTLLVTAMTILVLIPIAFAAYFANMQHEFFNNLRLGDLRVGQLSFASAVTPGAMTWQLGSAVLLLILSAGLAWPLVLHRWLQFSASNIGIFGTIDAAALKQATESMPKTSEGLLEALDPGIL
jgi:uncharacterized membrane protein YjgN (DUF898 family)